MAAMTWPWVSRGRFNDLQKRCTELEAERRDLLDRVLELSQQKPLYRAPEVPTVVPEPEKEDQGPAPAPPSRITISAVRNLANSAAQKAASSTGQPLWRPDVKPKIVNGN